MAGAGAARWLLYGAYGYTGELLARAAVAAGERPVLAGRDGTRLAALAQELGLEHRVAAIDDPSSLAHALDGVTAVAHCAGPFAITSQPMVDACLAHGVHMLDVTGEWAVIDAVLGRDAAARAAGCALVPASGWDVVSSDCLAATVAECVHEPRTVDIVIRPGGTPSRGTVRTAVRGMGEAPTCRDDGSYRSVPRELRSITAELPGGPCTAYAISWGDIATGWRSTGAGRVVTYARMPGAAAASGVGGAVLRAPLLGALVRRGIDIVAGRRRGADAAARARARCELWVRVTGSDGSAATGTMVTGDGYEFTAASALAAVRRLARGEVPAGAHTPSQAFGADFAATLPGVTVEVHVPTA